ncbi:hypothetical protein C0995_013200 [Termitomyces sp. Mi166|nr:hypothetical protein C0995_013200 [Termitomyces sp. Mi166\
MEEENDVLDWGAEEEENKNPDAGKNGATDARPIAGDNDDAEDAVSLGDEEEAQDFYLYQQEEQKEPVTEVENNEANIALPSASADDALSTATLSRLQREDSSPSQVPSSKTGTPRRNSSPGRRSPQPTLAPRITHALPPKPVVTTVPFLPPSHPSIVEATAMSAPTRTTSRSNGKSLTSGNELPPLPRGWEAREARSGSGGTYYYNVRTHESTWTRPVSNPSSSSPSRQFRDDSARRRGSDSFLGAKSSSPRRSDNSHSQSQEPSRHSKRVQPLEHVPATDLQIIPPSNATTMSYNDRHYRPGVDGINASGNTNDRHYRNREAADSRFNPRPDQASTTSPEASPRARARSVSPLPMSSQVISHGQDSRSTRPPRSSRGRRNSNTDADSSTFRDRDQLLGSYPARDSNTYQESRRHSHHHYETPYDASLDTGPPMPLRNGNTRGRRERDQPMREESRIQNMPDSRTRSPPLDKRDTHIHDDARHWAMLPSRRQEGHQATSKVVVSPQLSTYPPSQRKRDRPSRFGLQPGLPSARLPTVEMQTYPHRFMEEDDPFVPDDIRSPPPHELQQRREVFDEKLFQTSIQASENGSSASVSYRQVRHSEQTDERSELENVPSSEQHTRRARPPLPPQAAEFHEVSNRPRDRPRQDRAPSPSRHNDDGQPSMGLRDTQGVTHGDSSSSSRPRPYGQDQNHEDNHCEDSVDADYRRQTEIDMAHFSPEIQEDLRKQVDYNIKMRHFFKTQEEKEEEMARGSRYSGVRMGPLDIHTEDKSTGIGNYSSGQAYAPRGPRAMHPLVNQDEATSPTLQTGFGPGPRGGNRERSPPPHMGGRGRDNSGWREERIGQMPERGGRRERGRFNDYSRPPPSSASGPNSVPIGNQRKQLGNGSGGPGVPTRMPSGLPVPEMPEMNQRPARGGRGGGSMRGGAGAPSHPPRELQYERGYGNDHSDRFRPGKFENDGPISRRRDSSLPSFERQPPGVDTSISQRDRFSTSPLDTRYELASIDTSRLARTWTPRGEAPPEVFMGNSGTSSNDRHTTSPSISRASPNLSSLVDTGRPHSRYPDSRDQPGSSRGRPPPSDRQFHQMERFARQPNEPRRSGGLEGRLSDRFDDSASSRQTHALPPNPNQSNYSVNGDVLDLHTPDALSRHKGRRSFPGFYDLPNAERSERESDSYNVDADMDAPSHMHSKGGRDEYTGRKRRLDTRPDMPRRPGSLLERLEMSVDRNDAQEETFSRPLSDRVSVPSKRDRDEMAGDGYGLSDVLGVDDTDPASKKARRKNPRGKRVKMTQQ